MKICIAIPAVINTSSCSFLCNSKFSLPGYPILFTMDKTSEGKGGNVEWIALKLLEKFETQCLIHLSSLTRDFILFDLTQNLFPYRTPFQSLFLSLFLLLLFYEGTVCQDMSNSYLLCPVMSRVGREKGGRLSLVPLIEWCFWSTRKATRDV